MKGLVVYDSRYGNTEKIAMEIGRLLGSNLKVLMANEVKEADLKDLRFVVIGSPTHGGRPSENIIKFINIMPVGLRAVFFDTRLEKNNQGFGLKIVMSVIGYAAEKMERQFRNRGGKILVKAGGFMVTNKEGPIIKGELEKLKSWVDEIKEQSSILMVK
jgi:flavodoxin